MSTALRFWELGLAIGVLSSCAQPFGRLEGVLVDAQPDMRPVEPGETGRVEVTREGREQQGRPNMPLKKGDALVTGADGVGVMVLADGYRVIMDPGTDLTIENPSLFVRVGRIIVKKIKEIREALTVRTELGAAAVEGTEFVLEVNRRQDVEVKVLEGRVKVYSREGAASRDTLTFVGGERGRLDSARIDRLPALSARETDSLRRRIRRIEATVRPQVPDVIGYPEAEARAEMERSGLVPSVVQVITRQNRSGPEVGTVVSTSPPAGARIRQGARVRLSVEGESVAVPNVMGQPLQVALRILDRAGLRMGDTTSTVQPNARDGMVTGMQPGPGSYVRPGTRIALTIARAPVIERVDSGAGGERDRRVNRGIDRVEMCSVPNLVELTEEQAVEALKKARMQVGQIARATGSTVTGQDPAPGAARCGTPVSFTLGSTGGGQPR